jgi:methionyl aminopeptidase
MHNAGIPDGRPLASGDIINIDVTVYLDGHHGDTSRMFFVGGRGAASANAGRLVDTTKEALDAAVALVRPGLPVSAIGDAIQAVADREKLGIVREFVGHGVGRVFHSNPVIVHCRNREPGALVEGQTFTIEPMLTLGSPRSRMWKDGWTVVTADASLSAQFEHTLLVTKGGVEILTAWPDAAAVEGGGEAATAAA